MRLTYLVEAAVEEGKTRVTLPTTLYPRYSPDTDKSSAAGKLAEIQYSIASMNSDSKGEKIHSAPPLLNASEGVNESSHLGCHQSSPHFGQ